MLESLADSLKQLAEVINDNQDVIVRKLSGGKIDHIKGSMQEVICPFCGLNIELFSKMEYGYCKYCCNKISYKASKNKELNQELIDDLSGDEYYAIMQKEGRFDKNLAKAAAKKGSVLASLQLGDEYYADDDYDEAIKYFSIAAKAGDINGEYGVWLCEVTAYTFSSNISSGRLEEYLRRFKKFDLSKITIYEKSKIIDFRNKLNKLLSETKQEEERKKGNVIVLGSEDFAQIHKKAMEKMYPKKVTGYSDYRNGEKVYLQYDGTQSKFVNESGEEVPSKYLD